MGKQEGSRSEVSKLDTGLALYRSVLQHLSEQDVAPSFAYRCQVAQAAVAKLAPGRVREVQDVLDNLIWSCTTRDSLAFACDFLLLPIAHTPQRKRGREKPIG